ncbi:class I SAM-dependent methyltransferase [Hwanghaeella grinnelliae]|uniref:Class I SAM-dependent methyltransferase n=1 Tax=Hwanghaeella grinnelliae TaxID=2500179 RepID=A0A3S2Z625_9PROT|nr:class I SAM-dependent methyltransferase [Hwanghaeella grinnelliae]RVU34968.1 class I SAM-dependent methyltransferase [Hwanghaeella grinnelliae]
MADVHRMAEQGYQNAAATYSAGRPDYPDTLDPILRDELGITPGKTVLDLGAGTGKFTARLAATGAAVIAVEPVDAMRNELAAALPMVDLRAGNATAIPADTASIDAVFCAQAFHWFATAEALAEIRRVLKPDGLLGLVWNVRDETVDWVAGLTDLITPYEDDTPRYRHMVWRALFPAADFSELEETVCPYAHEGPAEQVVLDRFMSISFIASQPLAVRNKIEADIRRLIGQTPALSGPAPAAFPYVTRLYTCRKTQ